MSEIDHVSAAEMWRTEAGVQQLLRERSAWQPIETAPKDGTDVLAFGMAYPELAAKGSWFAADTNRPRVPYTMIVRWVEAWYDKEINNGDGTYRKERTQGYAYWGPEAHAFRPTHWMPLPLPPTHTDKETR